MTGFHQAAGSTVGRIFEHVDSYESRWFAWSVSYCHSLCHRMRSRSVRSQTSYLVGMMKDKLARLRDVKVQWPKTWTSKFGTIMVILGEIAIGVIIVYAMFFRK